MIQFYNTTLKGEQPTFVYYIGFEEDDKNKSSDKEAPQKEFLDDVEAFLRMHRPEVFNEMSQSS